MSLALALLLLFLALGAGIVVLGLSRRRSPARWTLVVIGLLIAALPAGVVVLFVSTAGDPATDPDSEPLLGARFEGDTLVLWTGLCRNVREAKVRLDRARSGDDAAWTWVAIRDGTHLETLRPPEAPEGMRADVRPAEPAQLLDFEAALVRVHTGDQRHAGGVALTEARSGSAQHPGQYWFGEAKGWRAPDEIARSRQLCG